MPGESAVVEHWYNSTGDTCQRTHPLTTIFFATDIHGSDICWHKFLNAGKFYGADVLILGGDLTGKAIVPVIHLGGKKYRLTLLEQVFPISDEYELEEMLKRVRSRGYYPYLTDPDELASLDTSPEKVHQLFLVEVLKVVEQWVALADKKMDGTGLRIYCSPGNDDMFEVDAILQSSRSVILAEGQVIPLDDHHELITSGWSNRTPWRTPREEDEDLLKARYNAMITRLENKRNAVFNLHVPPYASSLDEAPELDDNLRPMYAGQSLIPVGSRAVRDVIEDNQPLLSLHGHIHEGRGIARLGRTLCINPGSMYEQGTLLGAIVKLDQNKIENYVLTTG